MELTYSFDVERSPNAFGAWQDDLNVAATGDTPQACIKNMAEGCELMIESLIEDGRPIPAPKAQGNASVTYRILAAA